MLNFSTSSGKSATRDLGAGFVDFFNLASNRKASLWRSPVANLATDFPEQKSARGAAGFSFAPPIHRVPISKLQRRIGGLIRCQFPNNRIEQNVRPKWLRRPGLPPLELDFFLPELDLAFEVQGEQHFRYIPHFHRTPSAFDEQLERDRFKRKVCDQNRVTLVELTSASEYDEIQHQIQQAINNKKSEALRQHVLKRGGQTILNIINLTIKLKKVETEQPLHWKNSRIKCIRNREKNYEMLRYISIRAIQEFYGLAPFHRKTRKEFLAGRTEWVRMSRPKRKGKKRKGQWGNMREWV